MIHKALMSLSLCCHGFKTFAKIYLCYRWLSMKQSMNVTGAMIWRPTTKFKRCNLTNLVYFKSFLRLHQNCMLSSSLGIIVVIAKRYYLMHPAMLVALYSMNGKYNNIIYDKRGRYMCPLFLSCYSQCCKLNQRFLFNQVML